MSTEALVNIKISTQGRESITAMADDLKKAEKEAKELEENIRKVAKSTKELDEVADPALRKLIANERKAAAAGKSMFDALDKSGAKLEGSLGGAAGAAEKLFGSFKGGAASLKGLTAAGGAIAVVLNQALEIVGKIGALVTEIVTDIAEERRRGQSLIRTGAAALDISTAEKLLAAQKVLEPKLKGAGFSEERFGELAGALGQAIRSGAVPVGDDVEANARNFGSVVIALDAASKRLGVSAEEVAKTVGQGVAAGRGDFFDVLGSLLIQFDEFGQDFGKAAQTIKTVEVNEADAKKALDTTVGLFSERDLFVEFKQDFKDEVSESFTDPLKLAIIGLSGPFAIFTAEMITLGDAMDAGSEAVINYTNQTKASQQEFQQAASEAAADLRSAATAAAGAPRTLGQLAATPEGGKALDDILKNNENQVLELKDIKRLLELQIIDNERKALEDERRKAFGDETTGPLTAVDQATQEMTIE